MMGWLTIIVLALASFAAMVLLLKAPRPTWEVIGAALCLGFAGYALQGRPGLAGQPRAPVERIDGSAAAEIVQRQRLAAGPAMGDKHLVIADALARHGQFADAAEILRGAVRRNPANGEAWLAMANALVGHADGTISPAASFAYAEAERAAPGNPGPPFFEGLALIRSGQLAAGRARWADLLARSPAGAPWRAELEARLRELDAFLARETAAGPQIR